MVYNGVYYISYDISVGPLYRIDTIINIFCRKKKRIGFVGMCKLIPQGIQQKKIP